MSTNDDDLKNSKNKTKRTDDVISEDNVLFTQFKLKESILNGLSFNGFKYPSPIQTKSIPMGLLGLDLIIQAKSGTGKTCVFSVLALECIKIYSRVSQVLILSPTREIALQSMNVIQSIGRFIENLSCQLFIGGIKVNEDLKKIKNCHIIVGTPGRIKYLIENSHIQTDAIRLLILDEADMLFTDNFQNTMNYIYNSLPMNKQMLTLSATYTDEMIDTIVTYMNSPVMIRLSNNEKAALIGIAHYFKQVSNNSSPYETFWSKSQALIDILSAVDFLQCIIFSNYQSTAQDLCEILDSKGWPSAFISGNLDQKHRIDIYNKLKNFHCRVLITTDLTSRGIDAENVNLVINLNIPWNFETYLHRMGRAGRYGSYGAVINIVTNEEMALLNDIGERCSINLNQLPDNIPWDFLENQVSCKVDDVFVEKLSKLDHMNDFSKFFNTCKNDKKYNLHQLSISAITELSINKDINSYNFGAIFRKFQSKDNVVLEMSRKMNIANDNLYNFIESHLYRNPITSVTCEEIKSIIEQPQYCQNVDSLNKDIHDLENEFERLTRWALFYSRQFQITDQNIKIKMEELNNNVSMSSFFSNKV